MPDKAGMDKDEIFFFCSICNKRLTLDSDYYEEDDFIYCEDCWTKSKED